jgi:hypothetical protein
MEMNLEHVMNSKEFKSLYKNISENNSPLAVLPDEQRKIITYLYLSKNETLINGLTDALYRTKVPSIEDFMNIHMGEFGSNIFPKWRECLTEVFAPNSQVFELIFGGSIGAGKSAIGLTAQIYNLIRVLYLRNPQQTLGVPSITLLYLMMISITLDKGKFALMGQLVSLIEGCDLFVSVDDDSEFEDVMTIGKIPYWNQGSALLFPHKLRVIYGSNTRHALCLTGDTEVKLLNGTSKRIDELVGSVNNYVYSCTSEGKIIPGKITKAWKSGTVTKLVAVTLDNDQVIKCTPEHKFMLRDGTYKEAQYLQPKDSLMPLYSEIRNGYEYLRGNKDNKYFPTHSIMCSYTKNGYNEAIQRIGVDGNTSLAIHHKDHNSRNNNPDNLIYMGQLDHIRYHASKGSEHMAKLWSDPEFRKRKSLQVKEFFKEPVNKEKFNRVNDK